MQININDLWDRVYKYGTHGLSEETVDTLLYLIEKHTSKAVVKSIHNVYFCPNCKGSVWQNKDESYYCFRCGQKLDWN